MRSTAIILGGILAISVAGNGFQIYLQTKTQFLLDVEVKRNQINEDQINEFILSKRNGFADDTSAIESAKMQGKIEGIVSLVHNANPQQNEISSIWHAGYQRGLEQTEFVGEMKYEQGYAFGFQKGTSENMKSIQTILKSSDNIKGAIESFVNNQTKSVENVEKKEEIKPSK